MFMGDLFEIRGKSYGGRLGPTLSVGPNIRLCIGLHMIYILFKLFICFKLTWD